MTLSALGIFSAAGAGGAAPAGSFELIETVLLTGTQASVTFSGLSAYSSVYRHLQLRMVTRGTSIDSTRLRFNGDSSSLYTQHQLGGSGSSVFSNGDGNNTNMYLGLTNTDYGCPAITDILDAFSTTKNKTTRTLTGLSSFVFLRSGSYMSTSAISSVTVLCDTSLTSGSRLSLYGIKG